MKWHIPAKTFLLGEYVALAQGPAILLTSEPCFELSLIKQEALMEIHPRSPAGLWWQEQECPGYGLYWYDPYQGCGGLGASSAQFIGSYLASCSVKNNTPHIEELLGAYYHCAWSGQGLKPSGYDVIAQSHQGCVYINQQTKLTQSFAWPFADLSLFLIHTGFKLATHQHLQQTTLPKQIEYLSNLVENAKVAFEHTNSELLIHCINSYHLKLSELNLVSQHSLELIQELTTYPEVLAIKGCGALGADIILIITAKTDALSLQNKLATSNKRLVATEANLTQNTKNLYFRT